MKILVLAAMSWNRTEIPATFTVDVDGAPVQPATALVTVARLDDAAEVVTVTATPSGGSFWEQRVVLRYAPDGELVADVRDAPSVSVTTVGAGGPVSVSRVEVTVSRVRDASADALAQLSRPPSLRLGKPESIADLNVNGDFPPADWSVPDRPGIRFVDVAAPVVGGRVATVQRHAAGSVAECLVLELAGVRAPRLLAVSWPLALTRDDASPPTPFLIYYHPHMGQNVPDGYYVGPGLDPYPWNFDYCYFGMYAYQWYIDDPLVGSPFAKGIPLQIAAAGKDIVSVIPCNTAGGNEVGVFAEAASIEEVLLEIQAFMFRRAGMATPPAGLGRLAAAGFSSGTMFVGGMLGLTKNRAHHLLTDVLREVYLFDPPGDATDWVVAAALGWAGSPGSGRRVALYSQGAAKAHDDLLGKPAPSAPYVSSPSPDRTASVIPAGVWRATVEAASGAKRPGWGFDETHQVISALLLTHAVASGGF